jgi:hypothetical protein
VEVSIAEMPFLLSLQLERNGCTDAAYAIRPEFLHMPTFTRGNYRRNWNLTDWKSLTLLEIIAIVLSLHKIENHLWFLLIQLVV